MHMINLTNFNYFVSYSFDEEILHILGSLLPSSTGCIHWLSNHGTADGSYVDRFNFVSLNISICSVSFCQMVDFVQLFKTCLSFKKKLSRSSYYELEKFLWEKFRFILLLCNSKLWRGLEDLCFSDQPHYHLFHLKKQFGISAEVWRGAISKGR